MLSATAGRATAERNSLTDTCVIRRDPEGAHDDVLDEDRLEYTPPTDDSTAIYGTDAEPAACSVSPLATRAQHDEQGGQDLYDSDYLLRIPMTAPALQPGDVAILVTSPADPTLIGRPLFVVEPLGSSRGVLRRIRCSTKRRGPAH